MAYWLDRQRVSASRPAQRKRRGSQTLRARLIGRADLLAWFGQTQQGGSGQIFPCPFSACALCARRVGFVLPQMARMALSRIPKSRFLYANA